MKIISEGNTSFTFGFQRAEPIGALINVFTIWTLTIYLVYEAIKRLVVPPKHFEPEIMLITASFGVFANLLMAIVIFGFKIVYYVIQYPFMSKEKKESIKLSDGEENLNLQAVIIHILGIFLFIC